MVQPGEKLVVLQLDLRGSGRDVVEQEGQNMGVIDLMDLEGGSGAVNAGKGFPRAIMAQLELKKRRQNGWR